MRRVVVPVLLGSSFAVAEPASIEGRVVDARGAPVRGATISVEGSERTAITDARGHYRLTGVEPGSSLVVLADGFGAGLGTVTAGSVDDIVLIAEAEVAETIEITGERAPSAQGAVTVSRDQLERMPGASNDVMRALSAMPGIASYPLPLGSSGVVIRGSSPQDSRVLIDDFEVPRLYHDVGFRSIVPSQAIESLDYVPGGFDVAYGRASSGIVALTTRGGDERGGQQFESSTGELGVLARGAVGSRGRYMLSFRRSIVDLLMPLMLPDDLDLSLTTVPRYYDGQVRLDYRVSDRWRLRLSALGSDDALELYTSRDQLADKRFLTAGRFLRLTGSAHYHHGPVTAKLAISGITQAEEFERGLYQHIRTRAPALTTRAEVSRTAERYAGLRDAGWRVGFETVSTRHSLDLAAPRERREGEPPAIDDPSDLSVMYRGQVETTNLAGWTHVAASLDERIRLAGGLRVDAFTRARDASIQPRGELQVRLARPLVARLAAGAYSRPAEYQTELLEPRLQAERSRQLIAGLTYEPVAGVRLQGSLYHTQRRRLVTRDAMGELGNLGRGATVGGELVGTLNRGPWFGWLSYAYSHSTRVDLPGGSQRLFDFDQPHTLNAALSWKRGDWAIGARFRLHSGLPTTPVIDATYDSDANVYYPVYGPVSSERAPMHHQLDLRIDRRSRWGPIEITQFVDVQNVYLNDTVLTYFYGFDYTQRAAIRMLPILPTAGLRGEF